MKERFLMRTRPPFSCPTHRGCYVPGRWWTHGKDSLPGRDDAGYFLNTDDDPAWSSWPQQCSPPEDTCNTNSYLPRALTILLNRSPFLEFFYSFPASSTPPFRVRSSLSFLILSPPLFIPSTDFPSGCRLVFRLH